MGNNLPTEKKVLAVSMLAEGASIRAVERITGVHRDTIMRLGVRIGEACAKIHDERVRGLTCQQIQLDEIWGFIAKKRKNLKWGDDFKPIGDVWTFIALDRDTKIIPSFRVGIRSVLHTQAFIDDLASRLKNQIQLSSDQLQTYASAVHRGFGPEVAYGQIVKTYAVVNLNKDAASRYSPAEVVKAEKKIVFGQPEPTMICTSHVEKQNHTLRMHCRRLTRLTNAFSKKLENFKAAVALNFTYYNFCKRHLAVKTTPACAAGLEDRQWTVAELVERCGE